MKASEILREANRLLQKHGWTAFRLRNSYGCMCLEGALTAAVGLPGKQPSVVMPYVPEMSIAYDKLAEVAGDRYGTNPFEPDALYRYNDRDYRLEKRGRHGVPSVLLRDLSTAARRLEARGL